MHTYARKWVNEVQNEEKEWYRTIVYNFILIMANTGMRTIEARNPCAGATWTRESTNKGANSAVSTCAARTKYRELVAPQSVAMYKVPPPVLRSA